MSAPNIGYLKEKVSRWKLREERGLYGQPRGVPWWWGHSLTCPKCWVIGRRCCRRSERLVRLGTLREPPLCMQESPS